MAASTKTAPASDEVKGTTWLAEHVNSATGSEYNGYGIRILLRKLTKDGVIERGEGRYSFTGPRDKTVLAVVKAVKSGEADKAKAEKLDELKAKRAAKAAAAEEDAPKPARRSRAKKTAEVDEEPAPKPARRSRAKKAAEPEVEDEDLDIDEI